MAKSGSGSSVGYLVKPPGRIDESGLRLVYFLSPHIVTGDRRHLLPLGSYQGIFILDASHLASLMETGGGADENQDEAKA
jgi:hypothetical protein